MPRQARKAVSESPITSIFVPPFGLQGQELSCHVTWNREVALEFLEVDCGRGVRCAHVYNVSEAKLAMTGEGKHLRVEGTLENGYVGFVLGTDVLDLADTVIPIRVTGKFSIGGASSPFERDFALRLFRPDLSIVSCPDTIHVSFPPGAVRPVVEPAILFRNRGGGTALAIMVPDDGTKARFVDYFEMDKERDRYATLLLERLRNLKSDYPHLLPVINMWEGLLQAISKQEEGKILSSLEKLKSEMTSVERTEPDFIEDLADAFLDAFVATFALDLRFKAWIQTLEATRDQRIVLLNPWSSLSLNERPLETSFRLRYFDVLGREFPSIRIGPIRFDSKGTGLLPLHEFLHTSPNSLGERPEVLAKKFSKEVDAE